MLDIRIDIAREPLSETDRKSGQIPRLRNRPDKERWIPLSERLLFWASPA
jgi:hypothetical protein